MKGRSGKLPVEVAEIDAMLQECPNLEELREFMSDVPFDTVSSGRFREELRDRLWEILRREAETERERDDA